MPSPPFASAQPQQPIRYIHPAVLKRLGQGTFQPQRQDHPALLLSPNERRDALSPLAITKRCIRYEPAVFTSWTPEILRMASLLNDPAIRCVTVTGPEGSGKTSFMRGVVELMGGGPEQLVWLDTLPQQAPERFPAMLQETLHYLLQRLVARADWRPTPVANNPFTLPDTEKGTTGATPPHQWAALLDGLSEVSNLPLLVVLDHAETLLLPNRDKSQPPQWRVPQLDDLLAGLLRCPNVKLVLVGEGLPEAKRWVDQPGAAERLTLPALTEASIRQLMQGSLFDSALTRRSLIDTELIWQTVRHIEGAPWLTRCLVPLVRETTVNLHELKALLQSVPVGELATAEALTRFLWPRFTSEEQALFGVLAVLRQPLSHSTLRTLLRATGHSGQLFNEQSFNYSLIRLLLRSRVPPQQVIQAIQQGERRPGTAAVAWSFLYRPIRRQVQDLLSAEQHHRYHQTLAAFYAAEARLPESKRQSLASDAMVQQALQYHRQEAVLAGEGDKERASANPVEVFKSASLWDNRLQQTLIPPVVASVPASTPDIARPSPDDNAPFGPEHSLPAAAQQPQYPQQEDATLARLQQALQRNDDRQTSQALSQLCVLRYAQQKTLPSVLDRLASHLSQATAQQRGIYWCLLGLQQANQHDARAAVASFLVGLPLLTTVLDTQEPTLVASRSPATSYPPEILGALLADSSMTLARLYQLAGQQEKANRTLIDAWDTGQTLGWASAHETWVRLVLALAEQFYRKQAWDRAKKLLVPLRRWDTTFPRGLRQTLAWQQGQLALALERPREALEQFETYLTLAESPDGRFAGDLAAYRQAALAAEQLNQYAKVQAYAERLEQQAKIHEDTLLQVAAWQILARMAWRVERNADKARQYYQTMLRRGQTVLSTDSLQAIQAQLDRLPAATASPNDTQPRVARRMVGTLPRSGP